MVNMFVRHFSQIKVSPPFFILAFLRFLSKFQICEANHKFQLLLRLIETSIIPEAKVLESKHIKTSVEILFVCTGKDLVVLPAAISAAMSATSSHDITKITVVVPPNIVNEVKNSCVHLGSALEVVSEESLIPHHIFNKLNACFYERAGWVYQQLLKIEYVSNSKADGVLVCDADTLLIQPRMWLNSDGQQILTPTWEWHPSYYEFLSKFGLTPLRPMYTFVPHHMLMQPVFMIAARELLQWGSIENAVDCLISNRKEQDPSPFSIDYELYAQYLFKFHPEKVILSKWSNLALVRNDQNLNTALSGKYNSVSFHDHLI